MKQIDEKASPETEKWSWKMDWCLKNGLAPANNEVWQIAERAWIENYLTDRSEELKKAPA